MKLKDKTNLSFFWQKQQRIAGKINKKYYNKPIVASAMFLFFDFVLFLLYCFSKIWIFSTKNNNKTFKIAFRLGGGLGDVIVNGFFIEEFSKFFLSKINIDIQTKFPHETLAALFYKKNFINHIYNKKINTGNYDLVIDLIRYPIISKINEQRMHSLCNSEEIAYIKKLIEFNYKFSHICSTGLINDRLGMEYAFLKKLTRNTQADILQILDLKNKQNYQLECALDAEDVLGKFGLLNCIFITLQRGSAKGNEASKLWSVENYNQLAQQIKENYPEIKIVQLGMDYNALIENIDIDLRSKTSFEELKAILKESAIHIDGECGMVHLRHTLTSKKSIVVFGPTSDKFYGYANNINIKSDECGSACEWINNDWDNKCVIGDENPRCLSSISASMVFEKFQETINI